MEHPPTLIWVLISHTQTSVSLLWLDDLRYDLTILFDKVLMILMGPRETWSSIILHFYLFLHAGDRSKEEVFVGGIHML